MYITFWPPPYIPGLCCSVFAPLCLIFWPPPYIPGLCCPVLALLCLTFWHSPYIPGLCCPALALLSLSLWPPHTFPAYAVLFAHSCVSLSDLPHTFPAYVVLFSHSCVSLSDLQSPIHSRLMLSCSGTPVSHFLTSPIHSQLMLFCSRTPLSHFLTFPIHSRLCCPVLAPPWAMHSIIHTGIDREYFNLVASLKTPTPKPYSKALESRLTGFLSQLEYFTIIGGYTVAPIFKSSCERPGGSRVVLPAGWVGELTRWAMYPAICLWIELSWALIRESSCPVGLGYELWYHVSQNAYSVHHYTLSLSRCCSGGKSQFRANNSL